jgi:hypothetical protein
VSEFNKELTRLEEVIEKIHTTQNVSQKSLETYKTTFKQEMLQTKHIHTLSFISFIVFYNEKDIARNEQLEERVPPFNGL